MARRRGVEAEACRTRRRAASRAGEAGREGWAHVLREAQVDDELHVGVVVGVAAARHLDELISAADELRVRREVLRGRHDHELNRLLVSEGLVGPLTDRHDRLGRGHAVVGDEDPADQAVAAALLHVIPHPILQRRVALVVLSQVVHHRRLVGSHHGHGSRKARRAGGSGTSAARRPGRKSGRLHQPWTAKAGLERCNQRAHREQHRGRLAETGMVLGQRGGSWVWVVVRGCTRVRWACR